MCIRVVERYTKCRCIYYSHSLDVCLAYGRKGHDIKTREVLVGYTCSRHSELSDEPSKFESEAKDERPSGAQRSAASSINVMNQNSPLKNKLLQRVQKTPESRESYLPNGDLDEILTVETIMQELLNNSLSNIYEDILSRARRLFTILVLIDKLAALPSLLTDGLTDSDLPINMKRALENPTRFSTFLAWDLDIRTQFYATQWMLLTVNLREGEHVKLTDDAKFPFDNIEPITSGTYGSIARMTFTESLFGSHGTNQDRVFACKSFVDDGTHTGRKAFKRELANLRFIKRSVHSSKHVLGYLATFEYKGQLSIIFPLAQCNLRQFWADSRPSRALAKHCFKQMADLATGLSFLHFGLGANNTGTISGVHHDLKPENILIFTNIVKGDSWMISDFGLAAFSSKGSLELSPTAGRGTYEPPECSLNVPQLQKSDIWSFGCILLECATFLLRGPDAIEEFANNRIKDPALTSSDFKNDYFYTLNFDISSLPVGASLRSAVVNWISALYSNHGCDLMLSSFLRLIRDGLLQIDQSKRLDANETSHILNTMILSSNDSLETAAAKSTRPVTETISRLYKAFNAKFSDDLLGKQHDPQEQISSTTNHTGDSAYFLNTTRSSKLRKLGSDSPVAVLRSPADYAIGWICTLPNSELPAARMALDHKHPPPHPEFLDENVYAFGDINGHDIVIACLGSSEPGKATPQRNVQFVLQSFPNIKFCFFVGIASGIPHRPNLSDSPADIYLGDIVVGHAGKSGVPGVIEYSLAGRQFDGTEKLLRTEYEPPPLVLHGLDSVLSDHAMGRYGYLQHLETMIGQNKRWGYPGSEEDVFEENTSECCSALNHGHHSQANAIGNQEFVAKKDSVAKIKSSHESNMGGRVLRRPRFRQHPILHLGTIFCGDEIMHNAQYRNRIHEWNNNFTAFNIEATGLHKSSHAILIRGIADYADEHKNNDWRRYASATAAAFAKELLFQIKMDELSRIRPKGEFLTLVENLQADSSVSQVLPLAALPSHLTEEDMDRQVTRNEPQVGELCERMVESKEKSYTKVLSLSEKMELIEQADSYRAEATEYALSLSPILHHRLRIEECIISSRRIILQSRMGSSKLDIYRELTNAIEGISDALQKLQEVSLKAYFNVEEYASSWKQHIGRYINA